MTNNTTRSEKARKNILKWAMLLLMAAATFSVSSAQTTAVSKPITLADRTQTRRATIDQIENQTNYNVLYSDRLNVNAEVQYGKTNITLGEVLDKLTEGTGLTYAIDDKHIVVYWNEAMRTESLVAVNANRSIAGTMTDAAGKPLEGAIVEVVDVDGKGAVTFVNGRFQIEGVPSGRHILKLTSADGQTVRFREVDVAAGGDTEVTLVLAGATVESAVQATQSAPAAERVNAVKTTVYYVPNSVDNTIHALTGEPKTDMFFVSGSQVGKEYLPKFGIKTNLLYLATTTLNVAAEFGLARRWTLDVGAGFNAWDLNDRKGGIRHWLVQPEVRYWFCQRFEKHFIGLHGIGGQYQIQDIDLSPFGNDLTGKRYDGWGVGGGVSYGYHLPMGGRWAWEFTVGVGYIYLKYDEYNCGTCDTHVGKQAKHYFGPTKAGASLIFMIK